MCSSAIPANTEEIVYAVACAGDAFTEAAVDPRQPIRRYRVTRRRSQPTRRARLGSSLLDSEFRRLVSPNQGRAPVVWAVCRRH
jgi:hypothetical protein